MVWTTSDGDLKHPKRAEEHQETKIVLPIEDIKKPEAEVGNNREDEIKTVVIPASIEEVKNFEALGWHVVGDSDYFAGGEVYHGK
jgi:hypothetical protein